jgi:hypothetical protein
MPSVADIPYRFQIIFDVFLIDWTLLGHGLMGAEPLGRKLCSALELLSSDGKGRLGDVSFGAIFFAEEAFVDAILVNDRYTIDRRRRAAFKALCVFSLNRHLFKL